MPCFFRGLIVFYLYLIFALPVFAQSFDQPGLSLEYTFGFSGLCKLDAWTPLTVIAENRGANINGWLEIVVTTGSVYSGNISKTGYHKFLELPAGTRKAFSFTIFLSSHIHPVVVNFKDKKKIIGTQIIHLKDRVVEKEIIPVIGSGFETGLLNKLPNKFKVVRSQAKELPVSWFGYDSIKLLLSNLGALEDLDELRIKVLRQWIDQGGVLIIFGKIGDGFFSRHPFPELVPNQHLALIDYNKALATEKFSGKEFENKKSLLSRRSVYEKGEPFLFQDRFPIIWKIPIGTGDAYIVLIDTNSQAFAQWEGQKSFWDKLFTKIVPDKPVEFFIQASGIRQWFLAQLPKHMGNIVILVGFILIYLIVLFLAKNHLLKSSTTYWRGLLPLAVTISLFCSIALIPFFLGSQKLNPDIAVFSVVSGKSTSQVAQLQQYLAVYSLQGESIGLEAASPMIPVQMLRPQTSRQAKGLDLLLIDSPNRQEIEVNVGRWSDQYLMIKKPLKMDLKATIDRSHSESYFLKLDNQSTYNFFNLELNISGFSYPIGSLSAGMAVGKYIPLAEFSAKRENVKSPFSSGLLETSNPIIIGRVEGLPFLIQGSEYKKQKHSAWLAWEMLKVDSFY